MAKDRAVHCGAPAERVRPAGGEARRKARRQRSRCGPAARLVCSLALLLASVALGTARWAYAEAPGVAATLPRQQVLRRALRTDPGQEYLLYVPRGGGQQAALFVAVHGHSRNSDTHAASFAGYCETHGAVMVVPHFDEEEYRDYQRLGRVGHGGRADVVLDSIIAEAASLTGANAERFYLFGFSGGAQFAHRYLMAHPRRVASAVVAAAGWYTFPDGRVDFPYGIAPTPDLPGVRFDPAAFLRVPVAVIVGELDTGSKNLRHNEQVDRQQGLTRVERARNWVDAMRAAAEARSLVPRVSFTQVAGMDHSFQRFVQEGRLGERVFAFLFAAAENHGARPGDSSQVHESTLQPAGGAR